MKAVIDRIEGSLAVCRTLPEDREITLALDELPPVREGDVLDLGPPVTVDPVETQKRREKAKGWLRLWKNRP